MSTRVKRQSGPGPSAALAPSPVLRRILVVDDYPDAADSLVELLVLHGYIARAVYDLEAALAIAPTFRPDLVICEPVLRAADGFSLCRRMRQLPELSAVQFAAVTTLGDQQYAARLRMAGFQWYFFKPVDWDELLRALAHFRPARPEACEGAVHS